MLFGKVLSIHKQGWHFDGWSSLFDLLKILFSTTATTHPTYKHSSKEDFVNQAAPTVSGGVLRNVLLPD